MASTTAFKKALKKEQDAQARLHLDAYYWGLIKEGKAKKVIRVDWDNECEYSQILQLVGADVVLQKPNNKLSFMDEKICSNYGEKMYFEIDMAGKAEAGWAVSEAKKADNIVYYIKGYGVFVLPAVTLREWLLKEQGNFQMHFSKEGAGRKSNRNVVVSAGTVKEQFPNSFIPVEELERYAELIAQKAV